MFERKGLISYSKFLHGLLICGRQSCNAVATVCRVVGNIIATVSRLWQSASRPKFDGFSIRSVYAVSHKTVSMQLSSQKAIRIAY
jgi:hypothetical protein